ncbi:MAG: hypothetical protein WCX70_02850 [Candidatus Paceibacterota bacterium]|jgi:hypothetical protein
MMKRKILQVLKKKIKELEKFLEQDRQDLKHEVHEIMILLVEARKWIGSEEMRKHLQRFGALNHSKSF